MHLFVVAVKHCIQPERWIGFAFWQILELITKQGADFGGGRAKKRTPLFRFFERIM